jgi:hypothetical protein
MKNNNIETNPEIINKLMEENKIENETEEEQISISTARVSSIKYRLYVLVFLTLLILGVFDYILPTKDKIISLQNNIKNQEQQIDQFIAKKNQYEKDKDLISLIENKEKQIISCVNQRVWCQELEQQIRENFGFARSYLQVNNLSDPKMEFNEVILLANINEYLLKKIWSNDKQSIWKINSISFWSPKSIENQLYSIPIKIQATFANKDLLLMFIENVDKNVLENKEYRILYKIDEINYNIMEYYQEQNVDINLNAFYYID